MGTVVIVDIFDEIDKETNSFEIEDETIQPDIYIKMKNIKLQYNDFYNKFYNNLDIPEKEPYTKTYTKRYSVNNSTPIPIPYIKK